MTEHKIIIKDKSGNALGEFDKFLDLSYSKALNYYGECEFSVPATDDKLNSLISLRNYEIFIERNGGIVWGGEMVHKAGRLVENSDNKVTIRGYGFLEMLASRYTDALKTYASTDTGAIAWDLIDTTQNLTDGDLGITQGSIETTQDRDRTYENKNILDALVALTEIRNGIDLEVDDSKVFNVWGTRGVDRTNTTVFEYGTNILSANIDQDFTKPANEIIALGSGVGAAQLRVTATDTGLRSINKLRQQRVAFTDVKESATLTGKAEEFLRINKQSILSIEFEQVPGTQPSFGSIGLGDSIQMRISRDSYEIDQAFRVYGWNVSVGQDGRESISYEIASQ